MPRIFNRRFPLYIPKDAIYVGRGTPWGNPYFMRSEAQRDTVCDAFAEYAARKLAANPRWLEPLVGRDLVCWCQQPTDIKPKRCHAQTLLRLANGESDAVNAPTSSCPVADGERSAHAAPQR